MADALAAVRRSLPDAWWVSPRFRRAIATILPFLVWELGAQAAQNRLLPGPIAVMQELLVLLSGGQIWFHGRLTLQRGLIGLTIAIVLGLTFGILMARSRWFEAIFQPILAATYPVPKLALYPLLILSLGFGGASKIAMVALECFYPIAYNTYSGVGNIDKKYFWLARNVEAGRAARTAIMLRAAMPSIMASMRMAAPIMLVIIVVTELIGESRGLGFLIRQAGTNFQPTTSLAIILLLGIIGYALDRIIVAMTRRLAFWARGVEL
jgi:ABC-type nitrate/sulfonate/bicarbonate transport system permease component